MKKTIRTIGIVSVCMAVYYTIIMPFYAKWAKKQIKQIEEICKA